MLNYLVEIFTSSYVATITLSVFLIAFGMTITYLAEEGSKDDF